MNMKKTLVALAVALGSTVAFATTPVAPVVTSAPEAVTQKAEDGKKHEKREHKGERKGERGEKMKNLTPEQFAEMKAKHLNMLGNRKKILDNEIKCSEGAKNMDEMKNCFKSATQARKEVGLFPKHGKGPKPEGKGPRPEGKGPKHGGKHDDGVKREHRRDSLPDHPHVKPVDNAVPEAK